MLIACGGQSEVRAMGQSVVIVCRLLRQTLAFIISMFDLLVFKVLHRSVFGFISYFRYIGFILSFI